MWFEYASQRLLTLSVDNEEVAGVHVELGAAGELVMKAGVGSRALSLERWLFWRQRFKETAEREDEDWRKEGRRGSGHVINCGIEMGHDVPGEKMYSEQVQKALMDELKRSGKNFMSDQDLDLDLDWTE